MFFQDSFGFCFQDCESSVISTNYGINENILIYLFKEIKYLTLDSAYKKASTCMNRLGHVLASKQNENLKKYLNIFYFVSNFYTSLFKKNSNRTCI